MVRAGLLQPGCGGHPHHAGRLDEDRRRRGHGRLRLDPDRRPHEGPDQVRRRVDQLGRPGERHHEPPEGEGGRGRRHPPPEVGRASAGLRRPEGRRDRHRGGDPRPPQAAGGEVVAARCRRVHRRGAQDQRRQVLQEGPAQPLRRVRAQELKKDPGPHPSLKDPLPPTARTLAAGPCRGPARDGALADEGGLAGLAHHGPAGGLPVPHAAADVDRVEAVLVQPRGHPGGAAAGATGDVERVTLGQVVEASRDVAHPDVGRALDVAGHPLVVLTDVEDDGILGHLRGGHGRDLHRHHALHHATAGERSRTAKMEPMTRTLSPARKPAWSLSRSAIWLWITQGIIGSLVVGLAVVAFSLLVPGDEGPLPLLRWAAPVLAVLYVVVAVGVRPFVRYRVHRWEITGDSVYTLTGWLTRTWTLVPVARIQTVDVTRGVLQQLFGLASIAVLTASSQGTVRVPHLEVDVAERVAEDLARRAEQVRDEAT